ncbi:MAG: Fe3+ transporter permease [Devosia sp.]|nr:Fe3+ transporter permease [Devosia sp.]
MTAPAIDRAPSRFQPYTVITLLCAAFIVLLLVYPLARMFWGVIVGGPGGDLGDALATFTRPWFLPVLWNTVIIVGVSTVFALVIGATLAWVNVRTDASIGAVGSLMPIIPLLIPNVALAIGWVFVAAPRVGFLNGWLDLLPFNFEVNIYSWGGLIFVYTINAVPYVYLIVASALRNLDPALEEAARINGAGLFRTLRTVSIPAIRPALVSSALLVTITSLGVYSIPSVIATTAKIDLLTTRIVFLLNRDFPPKLAEAQALGLLMLAVVVVLWWGETRLARGGRFATLGGRAAGNSKIEMGRWKWPARGLTLAYLACTSLFPIGALLLVSLQPYWTPKVNFALLDFGNYYSALYVNRLAATAFGNSLFLSSVGALIAMGIAIVIAIYTVNRFNLVSATVDATIKSSAAIPNMILAVAFLVAFSGAPFFLAGSSMILLLAFIVMYIPPGSIAAAAAVNQVGRDLREASYTSGANEGRTVRKVVVPLAVPGFIAGGAIVFVHMMGDLSAAALLSGASNPVVGFAILTIWEAGTFGVLAAFSMMLCVVNILVIGALFGVGRLFGRR